MPPSPSTPSGSTSTTGPTARRRCGSGTARPRRCAVTSPPGTRSRPRTRSRSPRTGAMPSRSRSASRPETGRRCSPDRSGDRPPNPRVALAPGDAPHSPSPLLPPTTISHDLSPPPAPAPRPRHFYPPRGSLMTSRLPAPVRLALGPLLALLLVLGSSVPTPSAWADSAPLDPAAPATRATVTADALPTVQINGVVWEQAVVG